jgi:hypothetical protein
MKALFSLGRRGFLLTLVMLLTMTCVTAQRRALTQTVDKSPFEFHSGFWINLHHFLYQQALLRKRAASAAVQTTKREESATGTTGQLPAAEQRLWETALDYYNDKMVKRDLVFDVELVKINDRLAKLERASSLKGSGLSGELIGILEGVAQIYRARWWTEHDRSNQFWIAVLKPMLSQFSRPLVEQLTTAFKERWPAATIRVDVVVYANWAGAYTTFDDAQRVHTTISSTNEGNQGFAALETIFHEASHSMVGPREGSIAEAIASQCRAKNKDVPKGLWHALLFYTVGEITRRNLSHYGVSNYKPYAYANGVYDRGWQDFQRALELHWQPYLDGKVDFDSAMSSVIAAL